MTTSTALKSAVVPPDIGRYHLIAELAQGGMGTVYLATALGPGGFRKLVAIKELKPEFSDNATYVTMFLEEARLAARLIHPNIAQTYEVGSVGGRHYMVMEFLDGRSLHRIRKQFGERLPLGAHLRIISEALLGLHHVHELRAFNGEPLNIVHRDISPLNILVTFDGQAKVLDFGIAKTVDSLVETKLGVVKGRATYMAPEQADGAKVDRRADVYAAGVMIWEAAAGRRLWPNLKDTEILDRLVRERARSLRSVQPQAPADLDRICARAMALNPDDRYRTVDHLLEDLDAHIVRRHDSPTMREIGTFVGREFADERLEMNTVIEKAQNGWQRGPSSGVVKTSQRQRINGEEPTDAPTKVLTPSNSFRPYREDASLSALATSASARSARINEAARFALARRVMFAAGLLLVVVLSGAPSHTSTSQSHPQVSTGAPSSPPESAAVLPPPAAGSAASAGGGSIASPTTGHVQSAPTVATSPPPGRRTRSVTPRPTPPAAASRRSNSPQQAPAPPQQAAAPPCEPPYVVDLATGTKHWKLECF